MRPLYRSTLRIAALLIGLLTAHAPSHAALNDGSGIINVRDYGATGNGDTDDTAAIQAAVKAAAITRSELTPIGSTFQSGPVLVFPQGKYIVSDTFQVDSVLSIRGEGRAIIFQTDKDKHIFESKYAWRLSIKDLTFFGGKDQIHLFNPNVNSGQIIIEGCRFYGSTGAAIWNKVTSTTMKISDCEFIRCRQTWVSRDCDQSIMRDCWIETTRMGDYAAIEHHVGMMTLENIVGCPDEGSPKRRWIDNHAEWLTIKKFRFGGEGRGMTPVYQYKKYTGTILNNAPWNEMGTTLIMDDCFIVANGSEHQCAVYCFEVPNVLRLTNSILATGIPPLQWDDKIDLNTYFRSPYFADPNSRLLSYSIDGTIGTNVSLPKGLTKPVMNAP